MPQFDLPLAELMTYRSAVTAPADFDEFWARTLADARGHELRPTFTPVDTGLVAVETYDVEFSGFAGHRIKAWLTLPAAGVRAPGALPGVVQYQGYGGGRGLAHENLFWALAGYAHLMMDTRGQGSDWSVGNTADPVGSDASHKGFLTRGIHDPHDYFYRRVFTDAVRAVETLRSHDLVDPGRVAIAGVSQGGGIALAVAGLMPDVAAVLADVPFLCDIPRATEIVDTSPYNEIVGFLKIHRDLVWRVFATLRYFDGTVFAYRGKAPALFSVALMDQICPPSTVYAAHNVYGGPKRISVYPFNEHEGGEAFHRVEQLRWLREHV